MGVSMTRGLGRKGAARTEELLTKRNEDKQADDAAVLQAEPSKRTV